EDRRAFVAGARLARQHYHRTEIVARLARREIRDAVREDADLHAGSINVKRAAGGEREVRDVAFGASTACSGRRDEIGHRVRTAQMSRAIASPLSIFCSYRSCESIFCWAGVRVSFSAISASIWARASGEIPSASRSAGACAAVRTWELGDNTPSTTDDTRARTRTRLIQIPR